MVTSSGCERQNVGRMIHVGDQRAMRHQSHFRLARRAGSHIQHGGSSGVALRRECARRLRRSLAQPVRRGADLFQCQDCRICLAGQQDPLDMRNSRAAAFSAFIAFAFSTNTKRAPEASSVLAWSAKEGWYRAPRRWRRRPSRPYRRDKIRRAFPIAARRFRPCATPIARSPTAICWTAVAVLAPGPGSVFPAADGLMQRDVFRVRSRQSLRAPYKRCEASSGTMLPCQQMLLERRDRRSRGASAMRSAELALRLQAAGLRVETKPDESPVTIADRECGTTDRGGHRRRRFPRTEFWAKKARARNRATDGAGLSIPSMERAILCAAIRSMGRADRAGRRTAKLSRASSICRCLGRPAGRRAAAARFATTCGCVCLHRRSAPRRCFR